jgi:hypothetical protein
MAMATGALMEAESITMVREEQSLGGKSMAAAG